MLYSLCILTWQREWVPVFLPFKGSNPIMGAYPITLSNPNHPPPCLWSPIAHPSPPLSLLPVLLILLHASVTLKTSPTPPCLQTDPQSPATADGPTITGHSQDVSSLFPPSAGKVSVFFDSPHICCTPWKLCHPILLILSRESGQLSPTGFSWTESPTCQSRGTACFEGPGPCLLHLSWDC